MHISRATQVTGELFDALQRLIPQLTSNNPQPTESQLAGLLESEASTLLIARWPDQTGPIAGILALVIYRIPTGIRARIEDVVVDGAYRGKGIGEALTEEALRLAREAGANGVSLTSNPQRGAANRLYQRLGFQRRETNVYFFPFH
jgi:ribosomal protein S18 acetylase RimI-like enzyme